LELLCERVAAGLDDARAGGGGGAAAAAAAARRRRAKDRDQQCLGISLPGCLLPA
jgi:hypothetical protein